MYLVQSIPHFRVRKGELSICGTLCFGIWVWANQSDAEYDAGPTDSISFRILIENPGFTTSMLHFAGKHGAELKRTVSSDNLGEAAGFGWYNVTWKLSDFTVTGSPNYGAGIFVVPVSVRTYRCWRRTRARCLVEYPQNASSVSLIVFCQDRGYDDVWTVRNYFAASGIPLTVYVDTTTLDTAGF